MKAWLMAIAAVLLGTVLISRAPAAPAEEATTSGTVTQKTGALAEKIGARTEQASAPTEKEVAAHLDDVFKAWDSAVTPGCAVGVESHGQPAVLRAYGQADLEHGVANTPDTVFEAGSASKQFTAAAVLILAERHQLALSDDIRKYLPEIPRYDRVITIDQLLDHTSGLRDWGVIEEVAGWPRTTRAYTMDDVLAIAARQKALNYPPGEAYSYTNTGFNLLAIIVQRVSGKSMPVFTREQIFEPLGMRHTQWRDDFRRIVRDRAVAYHKTESGRTESGYETNMPFESAYGNGGLLSTVGDLLKWNAALTNGSLGTFVTSKLQQRGTLATGQSIDYARGLFIKSYHGSLQVAHDGATAGYRAWLGRYPQQELSIALLCNADDASTTALAHKIADPFLPALRPQQSRSVELPAATLARYYGKFVDERSGGILVLEGRSGHLGLKDGPLLDARSAGEFQGADLQLLFRDLDRFELRSGDGVASYERKPGYSPTTQELSSLAGRYVSEEAGVTYALSLRNGHIAMSLQSRPQMIIDLEPVYRDAFLADRDLVRFHRDSHGEVTGFSFSSPRLWDLRFRREEPGSTRLP